MITLRDSDTRKYQKSAKRWGIAFLIAWGIGVLFSLSITVGLIYVAIHFIHKLW